MLQTLLAKKPYLLADGATGTNLFAMGLESGEAPELWNDQHPDRVAQLHRGFIEAGADIILTNTFGANRRRLMLHNLQDRCAELNRKAAEIARRVAAEAGREIVVAGSLGPTGDLLAPLGPLSEAEAVEVFSEQIAGLRAGGADVVWIETMSAPEEIRAAAAAATAAAMPYTITASFDTAGRTMMGLAPSALGDFAALLAPGPLAVGANCGVGASDLLISILAMTEAHPEAVVIAKANCGIPQWHGDHIHYSGTPELMALYAGLAADAGARIIGGCCGTSAAHLAAMRRALDHHHRAARPTEIEVTAALGPIVSPGSKTASGEAAGRRGGRRRG